MVAAAVAAVIVANSPAYAPVQAILEQPLGLVLGPLTLSLSFKDFVNDFLMAVFFLLVGIELKYEMTVGQLHTPRQAALPVLAAVGGVMGPCIIYFVINAGTASVGGWAIPMVFVATMASLESAALSVEPALNENQQKNRMMVPMMAIGML